jgi:hypothetical protein
MTTLNDVPAEILLEILSHTGLKTKELWRFLGISKVIYAKVSRLAYRNELRSMYEEVKFSNLPSDQTCERFRSFLRTVVRRPDLAGMVKMVCVAQGWRRDMRGLNECTKTGRRKGDDKYFLDSGRSIGFHRDSINYKGPPNNRSTCNVRAWRAFSWSIQCHDLSAEIILMLAHLPNLEEFTIDIQTASSNLAWDRLLTSSTHSFTALKKLVLYGDPLQANSTAHGARDLSFLLSLPSLTYLHICNMDWTTDTLLPTQVRHLSNIKNVILEGCYMSSSTFANLADKLHSLDVFRFSAPKSARKQTDLNTLTFSHFLHNHRSTLKELEIEFSLLLSSRKIQQALGPLTSFACLHTLTIEHEGLMGPYNINDNTLMSLNMEDFLPSSIQHLTIWKPVVREFYSHMHRFATVCSREMDRFPALRTVEVRTDTGQIPNSLRDEFRSIGVDIVVKAL